jgi:arabinogalactan oligomer/maltooligosaccharide transport system permease protein
MKLISGRPLAVVAKVIFVSIALAILGMLAISALAANEWAIAGFLALSMAAIAIVYLTNISVPLKFFVPGLIFLVGFVVIPIVYTVVMSGFQYRTGNYISKPEALERVQALGVVQDESMTTYDVTIGRTDDGDLALLATDYMAGTYFISDQDSKTDVPVESVELNEFEVAIAAPGFNALPADELAQLDSELSSLRFYAEDNFYLVLEGFEVASLYTQVLNYDPAKDELVNIQTGAIFRDNGRGNYANIEDPEDVLIPGWRSPVWFENYLKLFSDPKVRDPFIGVFIWTVTFAFLTVLTQFAFGLLLALALNKPIRGRRAYRIILILPYAIPSIMSILVWAGMFNTEFGAINALLGQQIAWFLDPNFARAAVIVVNLWLGFPYFYLVSSGSLQAIPPDYAEAAAIDGASPRKIFWQITLPLLLKILAPLLIASFAFNFNNFNLIYLLTGGGPRAALDGEIAGATDILISYTYQIAFGSNIQDLGLASAISVVIFLIVAAISLYGVRKSKVLDEFA